MEKSRMTQFLNSFLMALKYFAMFSVLSNGYAYAESDASTKPAAEPFAFADFGWLNGNSRQTVFPLDFKAFTGEFNLDTNFIYDFNNPKDHTLSGSSNAGRTNEFQVQQLGIGADFHDENVRGRFMTQFGMYSTMTPREDASADRGQWNLSAAYQYLSEAYAGYHWDVWNGINLDVGLFLSYLGLCSYYNYENWVYQMSYVSSNTPWYFNGMRLQTFPSDKLKLEYWLVNGWQSYGMYNEAPGMGMQILDRPTGDTSFVSNEYFGADTLGVPGRSRYHSDNSFQLKYRDTPKNEISKAAFSITLDAGCENGGGVKCFGGNAGRPSQYVLGLMAYSRLWFAKDVYAVTLGGGFINNPGRYLAITPPVNGATSFYQSSAFPQNPGSEFQAWDASATFDFMPKQFITYRIEFVHRQADVPYFAGPGGLTPPGGNQGLPGSVVPGFSPDLRKSENRIDLAMMVRF